MKSFRKWKEKIIDFEKWKYFLSLKIDNRKSVDKKKENINK